MRAVFALTLIAGTGLMLTACGSKTSTTTDTAKTTVVTATENGAEDSMMGGMDGATGNVVVPADEAPAATDDSAPTKGKAKPKAKASSTITSNSTSE